MKKWSRKKVCYLTAGILLVSAATILQPLAHWKPCVHKNVPSPKNILSILDKSSLNKNDYSLLMEQMGLGKTAVDQMRRGNVYSKKDFLLFQTSYLQKKESRCISSTFFTKQDRLVTGTNERTPMAPLEDGDIFLCFSSHSLGWRHGHAGLLVDAEKGLCLEAVKPGTCSSLCPVDHWQDYDCFYILRLKTASLKERKEIACYARKNLNGIPYSLMSGFLPHQEQKQLKSQCAYLVWYAYKQFGYDLDSDGGRIVTVRDLMDSEQLELIQRSNVHGGI